MDNINLTNGGYVVLPLDEYNWLVRELEQARAAVKISKWTYSMPTRLEASIDPDWVHHVALKNASEKYDLNEYEAKHADDLMISSITIAVHKESTIAE